MNERLSGIKINNLNEQAIRVLQQIKKEDVDNTNGFVNDEITAAIKIMMEAKKKLQNKYDI